uniref:Uncharacterized protein n=1 Tax=Rhizophora mucronata TaxID=61149 RepID=A0A2P2P7Q5_RHIMU
MLVIVIFFYFSMSWHQHVQGFDKSLPWCNTLANMHSLVEMAIDM